MSDEYDRWLRERGAATETVDLSARSAEAGAMRALIAQHRPG